MQQESTRAPSWALDYVAACGSCQEEQAARGCAKCGAELCDGCAADHRCPSPPNALRDYHRAALELVGELVGGGPTLQPGRVVESLDCDSGRVLLLRAAELEAAARAFRDRARWLLQPKTLAGARVVPEAGAPRQRRGR